MASIDTDVEYAAWHLRREDSIVIFSNIVGVRITDLHISTGVVDCAQTLTIVGLASFAFKCAENGVNGNVFVCEWSSGVVVRCCWFYIHLLVVPLYH